MKKILLLLLFFLAGCRSNPLYYYSSRNAGEDLSGKKVVVLEPGGSITNTKAANVLNDILKNNGMKSQLMTEAMKKKKQPDYIATADIRKTSWQSFKTVPVWGKTGISSVNTTTRGNLYGNSYGTYDGITNYGYNGASHYGTYNGYSNYNYNGTSNTTVNYDYGVTGYQNVVVNNYLSCFFISIRKYDNKAQYSNLKVVHESRICVDDYSNDDEFLAYAKDIYTKNLMFMDSSGVYECTMNGISGACQPERTFWQKLGFN